MAPVDTDLIVESSFLSQEVILRVDILLITLGERGNSTGVDFS